MGVSMEGCKLLAITVGWRRLEFQRRSSGERPT
jgi:hypothetical protein